MKMRESRVLRKLRAGETVCSYKMNLADARVAEIAAMSGFDCIWACMEHVATDYNVIEHIVWASKAFDTDVCVRVARGSYSDYIRPLELDATGIMVPHVMSAEDARNIVRMTRFHPVGRRPVDGGNADGAYCNIEFTEYIRQANDQRFVILQIEDPEPLEELDEIAAVGGYDMLFFGPGDFSHGIGAPAAFDDPRVLDAQRRVVDTARRHGKFAGTVASVDNCRQLADMGYTFLNLGADVLALTQYARDLVGGFAEKMK